MVESEKAAGCGNYLCYPYRVFRRRLILSYTPPPNLTAPPVATALLAARVVLPPFGRLDVSRLVDITLLVDVERVPCPSTASRVSAASSNTLNLPLICPYSPLHHTRMKIHAPTPTWDGVLVVSSLGKTYRTGRAGDLEFVAYNFFFFKMPYVRGLSR
jgi:hypothetical protein